MAKNTGFAHHSKAAHAAHTAGDHATAARHIGKMFAMNRHAQRGSQQADPMEASEPGEAMPGAPEPRGLGNWVRGGMASKKAAPAAAGHPMSKVAATFARFRK